MSTHGYQNTKDSPPVQDKKTGASGSAPQTQTPGNSTPVLAAEYACLLEECRTPPYHCTTIWQHCMQLDVCAAQPVQGDAPSTMATTCAALGHVRYTRWPTYAARCIRHFDGTRELQTQLETWHTPAGSLSSVVRLVVHSGPKIMTATIDRADASHAPSDSHRRAVRVVCRNLASAAMYNCRTATTCQPRLNRAAPADVNTVR